MKNQTIRCCHLCSVAVLVLLGLASTARARFPDGRPKILHNGDKLTAARTFVRQALIVDSKKQDLLGALSQPGARLRLQLKRQPGGAKKEVVGFSVFVPPTKPGGDPRRLKITVREQRGLVRTKVEARDLGADYTTQHVFAVRGNRYALSDSGLQKDCVVTTVPTARGPFVPSLRTPAIRPVRLPYSW